MSLNWIFGATSSPLEEELALSRLGDPRRQRFMDVSQRLQLIDTLRWNTSLDRLSDWDYSTPFVIARQAGGLELYLLCTCIDALRPGGPTSFPDWIRSKRAKPDLMGVIESLTHLGAGEVERVNALRQVAIDLWKRYTAANTGAALQRGFAQAIVDLPAPLRSRHVITTANMVYLKGGR